ncbi:MAG: GNAT family N-acetyltransferase [Epulopiscium sp. Nele67-Bin004]|nr:MAG: GNAT family N-acetyltransferase [Epulopiscium sp. Nele67-Bin004]
MIRLQQPQDLPTILHLAREAFWNLYFPGTDIHCVVNKLQSSPDSIPELNFVITVDGKVQGAIFYTKAKVVSDEGTTDVISFGPVFINPDMHRKGLGRQLITHSIEQAKKLGYAAIMTLGYPHHYEPYGFVGGKKYHISMPDGVFYKGLLVLPLFDGALDNVSGHAIFSDALECTPAEIENFDKLFPPKVKLVTPSQQEYEVACAQIDN